MDKPRNFWLIPWSSGFECRTVKPDGNSIHVIEHSAYADLKFLLDYISDRVMPGEVDSIDSLREIIKENVNYRRAIDNITNGIPSEWAYAILRKERDQLALELSSLKKTNSLPHTEIYVTHLEDTCKIMHDALMEVSKDFGTDACDGNAMIAKEALDKCSEG